MKLKSSLLLGSVIVICIPVLAVAAPINKETTGADLTAGASWVGGSAPGSGDVATWASGTALGGALTLGSDVNWAGIDIQGASAAISTTGSGVLTLQGSGINIAFGAVNATLTQSITLGANQNWTVGSGRTLTVANAAGKTLTLSNKLTLNGAGQVNLGGTGATTVTGSGEIVVSSGILANNLQTGSSSTGRSGATTLDGGTVSLASSINMFGSGAIHLNSGAIGSFNTTGRDLGTGNAVNIGGNAQIGGTSGGLGTGYVRFGGATDLGGSVRTITAVASGVFSGNGAGAIFNGIVSNGGITKEGAGYITLGNNSNTFSGAVTINAGLLAFSSKALANASSVTLATSGVSLVIGENGAVTHDIQNLNGVSGSIIRSDFGISGTNTARTLKVTQGSDGTFAGTFTEGSSGRTIALLKEGTAKLTLTGSATGGYTGGTTISQGTIAAITNSNALGSSGSVTINDTNTGSNHTALLLGNITMARPVTVANQGSGSTTLGANGGAALPTFSGTITLAKDVTLDGTGNTDRLTFSGGIGGTGNVTISGGTNRVVFSNAANTYAGTTTVNAGSVLQLGLGGSSTINLIPDTSVVTVNSGGFVKLAKGANSETIGGLSGSGTVRGHEGVSAITSALVIDGGASQDFSGVLEDGGAAGSTLSLTKTGAGTQTISGVSTYTGTTTISGGTLALSGTGSIANTPSISVAAPATLDVSAVSFTLGVSQTLTGAGTVIGTVGNGILGGTITPSGGNLSIGSLAYSGDGIINVTPGTAIVNVTNPDGLTTSPDPVTINVQGAALTAGQYPVIDYSGSIQGSGVGSFEVGTTPGGAFSYTLVNNPGNSSVDLKVSSLADVWSGAFSNEWSTASIGGSKNWTLNSLPADYANGHDVQFTDDATSTTVDISAADVTPTSVAFINSSKDYTLQGSFGIAGSIGFAKSGTGTLTINNLNKFAGNPTITSGTVVVASVADGGVDSPLGAGTDIDIGNATLSYTGASASTDRFLNLTGPSTLEVVSPGSVLTSTGSVIGSSQLTKTGDGVLEIAASNGSFSGATQINDGTLRIAEGGSWGNGAITNNATLELSQTTAHTLTNAISGSGSLVKNGSGTLTLTAASSYTGGTSIGNGQLNIGNGTNNTASAGTGTIDIASGASLALAWNSGVLVLSNPLTGSGTVIRGGGGEIALTGTNSFSGTHQINANTLAFRTLGSAAGQPKVVIASGANLALGNDFAGQTCTITELSGAGGVNPQFDAASGTKTLAVNQSADTTYSGVMRDATSGSRFLAVTKSGSGTLTLSGTHTYTGATQISGGTLAITGSLANTAVTVKSGGSLSGSGNLGGSVTIEAGGTHSLAVAATPGTQVTRTITGALNLSADGDILALTATSAPANGTYILATATGGITGTPEIVNQTGVSGTFSISGNDLILTVGSDYDTWAGPSGFNLTQGPSGDDDGDGVTNFQEYAFGLNPTSSSSVSPVTAPDKTAGTFTYTRRKQSLTGLTYSYESSTNLSGWTGFSPASESSNSGDPVETLTVTLPPALLGEGNLFLRVKAVQP